MDSYKKWESYPQTMDGPVPSNVVNMIAIVDEKIYCRVQYEGEIHTQTYEWTGKVWEKQPYGYDYLNTDNLRIMVY